MKAKSRTGKRTLGVMVGALATVFGCSKPNAPEPVIAELYLNVEANQDSNYCKAEVVASAPCSVYTQVNEGDKLFSKKGAYVNDHKDITAFIYDNIPRPFDGEVLAFGPNSPDTIRKYFAFTDLRVSGVGGPNDTLPPENRPAPVDFTNPDTNKVTPPDTLPADTSGKGGDNGDPNQGGFKRRAGIGGHLDIYDQILSGKIAYAYNRQRNVSYKPRQYCGKV